MQAMLLKNNICNFFYPTIKERIITSKSCNNILLNIPLRVLTPEEESGQISLSGNDWEVLSEEDFEALKQEKKEASNPFAQLNGLFDDN